MDAPKISKERDIDLEQAKYEYIELVGYLNNPPQFGWIRHIQSGIEDRMSFLEKTITHFICEVN